MSWSGQAWSDAPWASLRAAAGPASYTLTAEAGSYAITGTAASLEHGFLLSAVSGSYVLTGSVATLRRGFPIIAAGGSYVISGTAVGLRATRLIAAVSGSYMLTGSVAALAKGRTIAADAGSYVLSGMVASLEVGFRLVAASGAYVLSGTVAALSKGRTLVAVPGSYILSGTDVIFDTTHVEKVDRRGGGFRRGFARHRLLAVAFRIPERPAFVPPEFIVSPLTPRLASVELRIPYGGGVATMVLPVLRVPTEWHSLKLGAPVLRANLAVPTTWAPVLRTPLGARLAELHGVRLVAPRIPELLLSQVRMTTPDEEDVSWMVLL